LLPRAAFVLYDPIKSEQVDGRRVRVNFDLEAAFLAGRYGRSVTKTQHFEPPAERDHLFGKRTPKVSSVTTRVETAEVGVQLAFRGPNAGLISNDQGSIHGNHRTPASGFGLDPVQNLVNTFQAGDITKVQLRTFQRDGSQTTRLSIPTKIDSNERVHEGRISSTASPTDIRPGVTTKLLRPSRPLNSLRIRRSTPKSC
jgi:hypothetical protein